MEVLPYFGTEEKSKGKNNLDLKDKKLLSILGSNARMPLTQISKSVQLSRDAVNYRINSYFEKGILKGSRTIVNIKKFGYDSYHFFINLKGQSESVEKKLMKKISSLDYVRAVLKFYGHYELEIAVIAKDNDELEKIATELTEILESEGKEIELLILTKNLRSSPFPKSFLKEKNPTVFKQIERKHLADKTDLKILEVLRDNANISLVSLSEKIKLSADALNYRIKNLQSSNHIVGFSYIVNYSAINYDVYTLLLNVSSLNQEDEKKLRLFFSTDENVFWAVKTIGKFNVLAYFAMEEISQLHNSIKKIKELFPEKLSNNEYLSAVAEYKYTYAPDCLFK